MTKSIGLRRELAPGELPPEPLWDKEWIERFATIAGQRHEALRAFATVASFWLPQLVAILHGSVPTAAAPDAPYKVRDDLVAIVRRLEACVANGSFQLPCTATKWVAWCDQNGQRVEPAFRAGAAQIREIPHSSGSAAAATPPVEADTDTAGSGRSANRCGRRAVTVRNQELHVRTLEVAQSMAADGTLMSKPDVVAVIADEFDLVEGTVSRIIGKYKMPWGELVDQAGRVRRARRRK